jgi:hypothetical protein
MPLEDEEPLSCGEEAEEIGEGYEFALILRIWAATWGLLKVESAGPGIQASALTVGKESYLAKRNEERRA